MKLYLQIFSSMFIVGLFTFGGGLAMLPQITRVFVHKRGWISEEELVDYFAISQTLPGVIATNTSVMLGYRIAGITGAFFAALGAILPSFIILTIVAVLYAAVAENPIVLGALRGIGAAVVALLFYTVWGLRKSTLRGVIDVFLCLAAAGLVLWGINPVFVILGGFAAGVARAVAKARRSAS